MHAQVQEGVGAAVFHGVHRSQGRRFIGQIAVTAAIGYGLVTFAEVLFTHWFDFGAHMADWGISYNASVYILYFAFLLASCLINVFDIRITSGLNTISAYWHMAGVAFIVLVLIVVRLASMGARFLRRRWLVTGFA